MNEEEIEVTNKFSREHGDGSILTNVCSDSGIEHSVEHSCSILQGIIQGRHNDN